MRVGSVELLFVVMVLLSLAPFSVAVFIQQFKLPRNMRGLRPSSIRALKLAYQVPAHASHRVVRMYVLATVLLCALLLGSLAAWQFIDIAPLAVDSAGVSAPGR